MKRPTIILGIFILIALAIIDVSAQQTCRANANSIYFSDAGAVGVTPVLGVHPGNKKGYYLNIVGDGAGNFDVTKTTYMSGLSVANAGAGAVMWQVYFEENKAQVIPSMKMTNKCTGATKLHKLDADVRLFNQ